MSQTKILFCQCANSQAVPEAVKEQVLRGLESAGVAFESVDDLCGLAARRGSLLDQAAKASVLTIVACFPRAVRWLFAAAGSPLPSAGVRILNMRTQVAEEILGALALPSLASCQPTRELPLAARALTASQSTIRDPQSAIDSWLPWFPVIDLGRCQQCRQCLNFCLFGVYGLSADGKVEVQRPANCKTNCPACARVCPQAAIIFPKYPAAPINGDEVTAENLRQQGAGGDLTQLVQLDVQAVLRSRSQAGGLPVAGEQDVQRALQERLKCSCDAKGQDAGACQPIKSLMSLPVFDALTPAARQILAAAKAQTSAERGIPNAELTSDAGERQAPDRPASTPNSESRIPNSPLPKDPDARRE